MQIDSHTPTYAHLYASTCKQSKAASYCKHTARVKMLTYTYTRDSPTSVTAQSREDDGEKLVKMIFQDVKYLTPQ